MNFNREEWGKEMSDLIKKQVQIEPHLNKGRNRKLFQTKIGYRTFLQITGDNMTNWCFTVQIEV